MYRVVQIWPGQTVTCLHTDRPGHIWTTLYVNGHYSFRRWEWDKESSGKDVKLYRPYNTNTAHVEWWWWGGGRRRALLLITGAGETIRKAAKHEVKELQKTAILCTAHILGESTRWFKYDRDWLCVNKSQFVPVIFEPPCTNVKVQNI